jgi:hypothetical protein
MRAAIFERPGLENLKVIDSAEIPKTSDHEVIFAAIFILYPSIYRRELFVAVLNYCAFSCVYTDLSK